MLKKLVLPGALLVVAVILFVLNRKQHHQYLKLQHLNHELASEINSARAENENLKETIRQMQYAKAASNLLHPTFVNRQKYYRQNWENYIQPEVNDYKTGLIGGIHNLKVGVNNKTDYTLDQVSIAVQYFRSNGKRFKTETVTLEHVPAQNIAQIAAPDSRRGMSVKARLVSITSREMNFCWTENMKVDPGEADPWRCAGKD